MVKKTYTFGLLAAALIMVPTAAFAQSGTQQELNQSATAVGYGSRVNQRANETSIQRQTRVGNHYGCGWDTQSQGSSQLANQNGTAFDGGHVDQRANLISRQTQIAVGHHCN